MRQRLALHTLVENVVSTINGVISLSSSSSFRGLYFSPRRSCPRNFSIKVLAISENSKILNFYFFEHEFTKCEKVKKIKFKS